MAVQLDTLLPLLTLQPRDLMVAIDGSRSELELQVKKQTTMTGIPPIFSVRAYCMDGKTHWRGCVL